MASAFENRLRRTIEMAGTDGQTGPVPVMATPSDQGLVFDDLTRDALRTVVTPVSQYVERIRSMTTLSGISLTAAGGSGTMALDGATQVDGKPVLRVASNNATANIRLGVDLSGYGYGIAPDDRRDIGVKLKITNAAKLSYINFVISDGSGLSHCYQNTKFQTPSTDGLYYVPLYQKDFAVYQGSPTGKTMKYMRIDILPLAGNSTGPAVEVEIIELVRFKKRKSRTVLSFDDGHNTCPQIADLLEKRGMRATFYVYVDGLDAGTMTIAQMRDLYARGHDIAVHNRAHLNLTQMGSDAAYFAAQQYCRDYIRDNIGPRAADHAAFVGGQSSPALIAMMSDAGFRSTRAAAPIYGGYTNAGWGTGIENLWQNPRYRTNTWEMYSSTTLAAMIAAHQDAIAASQDFFAYGHQLYAAAGLSAWSNVPGDLYSMPDYFDWIAQQRDAGLTDVMTISEFWG